MKTVATIQPLLMIIQAQLQCQIKTSTPPTNLYTNRRNLDGCGGSFFASAHPFFAYLGRFCGILWAKGERTMKKEEKEPVNTTSPLWLKRASECTEQDYNDFYHKVFPDFNDPLFSIHINADYPLNFKGVLFFPTIKKGVEAPKPEETKVEQTKPEVTKVETPKAVSLLDDLNSTPKATKK